MASGEDEPNSPGLPKLVPYEENDVADKDASEGPDTAPPPLVSSSQSRDNMDTKESIIEGAEDVAQNEIAEPDAGVQERETPVDESGDAPSVKSETLPKSKSMEEQFEANEQKDGGSAEKCWGVQPEEMAVKQDFLPSEEMLPETKIQSREDEPRQENVEHVESEIKIQTDVVKHDGDSELHAAKPVAFQNEEKEKDQVASKNDFPSRGKSSSKLNWAPFSFLDFFSAGEQYCKHLETTRIHNVHYIPLICQCYKCW